MKLRDRKLSILRQLSQEAAPIGLNDLVAKLHPDCSDRTVRRCLNMLANEGLVEKSGSKKGTKYRAVRGNGASAGPVSSCFGSDSLRALDVVGRPVYERQPVAYNEDWFDFYEPNVNFYLTEALREQLSMAGQRANEQDPAGTYARQIFNRLLVDLSYNSSRLEGNTYSLLDTERLLLHGDSAEGKLDEEKVMILNHKEAIRYLIDNASRLIISLQTVCTLHFLLSDGLVEPQYAGKVRDHAVRIGGSTHMPFEHPGRLQLQLEQIADKAAKIEDPFEQSFFLLVHISYLQAFADVNKRTARLSANISLITQNLVPLSFNDVEVQDYLSAIIAIYELQDIRPLVDLYVYSYMQTCAAYDTTVKALGFDEVRVRYRQQRRSVISEIIRKRLVGSSMEEYIRTETRESIPESDRQAFIEDAMEDLEQIDYSRIVGLGITPEQLDEWLALYR